MKTSNEIIAHLINKPQNSKIVQKKCIQKLISLLPLPLQNAVLFTYIKNRTLFFVLNHPGYHMEFNYKQNLIKSLLEKMRDIDRTCQSIEVDGIKSFVSNTIQTPQKTKPPKTYRERATGDFDNCAATESLHALFEEIKIAIKQNRCA